MYSPIDYSRAGEQLIIQQYLPASVPRILVDVGARDGLTSSLSRHFVRHGWRALLIEPDTAAFRELKQNCNDLPQADLLNVRCSSVDAENKKGKDGIRDRRLTTILAEAQMPRDLGLLVLNSSKAALEILQGFDVYRFHPVLIISHDGPANGEMRRKKYDLLSSYKYRYSGLAGEYSIWSSYDEMPEQSFCPHGTAIPELPGRGTGRAFFDEAPIEHGAAGTLSHRNFMVSGWACADLGSDPPPTVYVVIHDERNGSVEYVQASRYARSDVSAHFKQPHLLMSGFRALVPLPSRPHGSLALTVLQADSRNYYEVDVKLRIQTEAQEFERISRQGLARRFLYGSGVEIGALQRSLPLPVGCSVRYVDRMGLEELVHHYPELGNLPLQAPDLIDDGETISRIADQSQDFVVANHFFEHSENPIQTLSNLLRVIRPGGMLFMAVPDKRYTFDFDRPTTEYCNLRLAYETGIRADRTRLFEEWVRYIQGQIGSEAEARVTELMAENYSIHYNVWTADDLLQFLFKARSDFKLPFHVVSVNCSENEIIVILERLSLLNRVLDHY